MADHVYGIRKSPLPSLRANPCASRGSVAIQQHTQIRSLDCFASLAMTLPGYLLRLVSPKSLALAMFILSVTACNPTVKVEAPDKPIEINLNIKIEQEIRVRVERDLEKVFQEDPELFGKSKTS